MSALESNTVYMTLNSRGIRGTFHWGLLVTSAAPKGLYYHATNKAGGWQLEAKPSSNAMNSMSLVLVYKLGDVSSPDQVDQVLRSVPADGSPSLRTGEAFTCRIWLKDAIMALDKNQLLKLAAHIDDIEKKAFAAATRLEPAIEEGLIKAKIVSTGSSSSSSSRW